MTIALVLSGGTGTRLGGDIPKQYIEVNGRTIISYTLETLLTHENIDGVVVVANLNYYEKIHAEVRTLTECCGGDISGKFLGIASPGATRQLSIFNGMLAIRDIMEHAGEPEPDYIFIHDAARPLLSVDMISRCMKAVSGHQGVLPVIPMKDTVYLSTDGGHSVDSLLDRSQIYAGQAPEVFSFATYLQANRLLITGEIKYNSEGVLAPDETSPIYKINGSTEPAVMAGMDIAMIPGDEHNYKITTREDLERFIADIG